MGFPFFLIVRLNRYLSQCGVASRRGCEQIVLEGRVSINGHPVTELATQVAESDQVQVDGKAVRQAPGIVVAFHKPKGFICSRGDTHDRATIYAILPPQYQTLHYVGRLDKESEGLLLLTNRGDLSQRLTHPSEGVEKEYEVTIDNDFAPEHKLKLLHGMMTEEGFAKAERVWVDSSRRIFVVLKQGLKRQIRLMFYQLGYEVERLLRVRVGGLYLKGLSRGAWKELSEAEVERYFIKHKERERTARPAKSKGDDEGSDTFSPDSAAPFKMRPGPKDRGTTVRKPRRATKDKDTKATGDRLVRKSRNDAEGEVPVKKARPYVERAPRRSSAGGKPSYSSRKKDSETSGELEGDAPAKKRPYTARAPSRSSAIGKPSYSARKKTTRPDFKSGNKAPRGKGKR